MAEEGRFQNIKAPYLTLAKGSVPATPVADHVRLFVDEADGIPKIVDEADVVSKLGGGRDLVASATPSGVATVSFTGIPSDGTNLRLEMIMRGTQASNNTSISLFFNNDTTNANYSITYIEAHRNGPALYSGGFETANIGAIPAASSPAGSAAHFVVDILFYTNTSFHKMAATRSLYAYDASSLRVVSDFMNMVWKNTAAITRIDLTLASGNFESGSVMNLYKL